MCAYLAENGYAVVKQVASPSEVEKSKELMWEYLESFPGMEVDRKDPATWNNNNWLPSSTNGILHGFGFGQSKFMWSLRMLPKIKTAYSAVWGTEELLVSFDGGNAFRPWQHDKSWLTDGGWYHVDQNALRPEMDGKACIQGLVTLCRANENTGGLVVIPQSHKQHSAMCQRLATPEQGDFVTIAGGDPILAGVTARLVCAEPGDLILWDSRTVHCNTPALTALANVDAAAAECAEPDGGWALIRQVGYVCMTPKAMATPQILEDRCEGFVTNVSCSHWPHRFVVGGRALMHTEDNDPELISDAQRQLIGYGPRPVVNEEKDGARCSSGLCNLL